MTYFFPTSSLVDLRRQYYDLAKQHHPDVGGSTEVMQAINQEYEMMFRKIKFLGMDTPNQIDTEMEAMNNFIREFMMKHPLEKFLIITSVVMHIAKSSKR